jgi:hypothetical protein
MGTLDLSTLRKRLQRALGDEFTVGALLGEGGFAAVFRVRDTALERDVAIKVVDLGLTPSPALAERFVREARTVARLEHANIVPIYKVGGYKNEVLYIVMRCVDGPSVRKLIETEQRLPIADAARVARQVADALAHAHRHGIVHRDIKPDNILLDSTGRVVVTDFGIAKAAEAATPSHLTTEGMVVGTPQYMSPEQATGDSTDGRSDVYSLGVVLYHMLAGTPPFDGETAQAILMKQATATPVPIRRLRRHVSQPLAAVLERMLAKDPAERYQTAEEVSQALVNALPTAARDRVRVRYRWMSTAIKSLVGVALVGSLAVVAFAAGAAVVAWAVLSGPPRLDATAPFSDSLTNALLRRGALLPRDTGLFAFIPDGPQDSVLLLVTKRRVAVATPSGTRSYPRGGVTYGLDMRWGVGPRFLLILRAARGRRDTVFTDLSPRGFYQLTRRLSPLLREDGDPPALRRTD